MKGAGSNSWLVPLADLSLILFVITGSGLAGVTTERGEEAQHAGAVEGIASAVFADAGSGDSEFAEWLAHHQPGPGEQFTVLGTYRSPSNRAQVAARCEELAAAAEAQGLAPRVIVQQGEAGQVLAYFAYDRIAPVARDLQSEGQ
ncbi:MAG: hypothetical protein JY451_06970 [Erythrobacter sp.]|nr:MAG: hypothetical protein JY451_06970 [Erythrobacter sp.]